MASPTIMTEILYGVDNFSNDTDACGNHNRFHWPDYVILAVTLIISAGIGLFYGCFGPKQKTASDFLLGGSSMGTFPMAMSLASSFITAIELLGNPAEMYVYGTQFWMTCIAFTLVIPITSHFYLPVYRHLKLTSAYEYLEMRFNSYVRTYGAAMYMLQMILYTSVAVYAPALALSHVTGLNTYIAVSCIYIVCIFYASQGGMKAVMITDTFQAAVLVGSILVVLGVGDRMAGGSGVVWNHNSVSERIELFKMDPSPTVRHSFWSVVIGGTFYWLTMFCSNQASVQKYLSVESITQARQALWVSCGGLILIFTINFYTGMIMYAAYHDCDPLKNSEITARDQLLPLYVMTYMGHLQGVPGLFVAGIFSASLGGFSSELPDSCDGERLYPRSTQMGIARAAGSENRKMDFLHLWAAQLRARVCRGADGERAPALSFNGMVGGITLGLFSLGMFFPWSNSKGALCGAAIATGLVVWIGIGTQIALASGVIVYEEKFTTVSGCACENVTEVPYTTLPDVQIQETRWWLELYKLSYLWYSLLGFLTTIIVGLVFSILTGSLDSCHLDEDLMSPPVKRLLESLPSNIKRMLRLSEEVRGFDCSRWTPVCALKFIYP
ncbi:sodium-coupled monocarboxylate transporter 1-like isoform X2 [Zootermopsis nevadensis]|uniref:sodium-coupled monocarboxylate transporter 1-like isoform X2 n=1 Tax=Zootermopsis nevadensis TaxID=136037 RepID=UPI000B8E4486|nr:sodium-coupled monocarboxylate transporter 1-like isoform X2 [Zootermopsis nevadensis]